jgi:hypothetical protein
MLPVERFMVSLSSLAKKAFSAVTFSEYFMLFSPFFSVAALFSQALSVQVFSLSLVCQTLFTFVVAVFFRWIFYVLP